MKTHNSIAHLSAKEQNSLHCIKKRIAEQLRPLLIYCWNSHVTYTLQRNCFISKCSTEDWKFSCNLLLVMPEDTLVNDGMQEEIVTLTVPYGTVHTLIHPVGFVAAKLKENNLFFNWVHRSATLLYERDNALQQLQPPIPRLKEYSLQAAAYCLNNPDMPNYLEEKLIHIAVPPAAPGIANYSTKAQGAGVIYTITCTQVPKNQKEKQITPVEIHLVLENKNSAPGQADTETSQVASI